MSKIKDFTLSIDVEGTRDEVEAWAERVWEFALSAGMVNVGGYSVDKD